MKKKCRGRMIAGNEVEEVQSPCKRDGFGASASTKEHSLGWDGRDNEDDSAASGDSSDAEAWRRLKQRISGTALDQMVSHTVSCGWVERKYSDVVLVVMGEAFKLHRMILSRSRYFEGLFSGPWAESEDKVVHLQIDNPYITVESLNVVFGYIYGAKPIITSENARSVLAAGSYFEVHDIVDLATDFIQQDINAQTFLEYEKFVAFGDYGISSQKIKESCWALICFLGAGKLKESIAKLPLDRLIKILTTDSVWFSGEVERFRVLRETLGLWEAHHLKPKLHSAMRCVVEELIDSVCRLDGGDDDSSSSNNNNNSNNTPMTYSDHSESSAVVDDHDNDEEEDDEDDKKPDISSASALEEYEALERDEYEAIVHIVSHKINFWDMSFKEQAKIKNQLLREHLPVEAVVSGPWIQDWLRDKISNPYLDLGLDDPRAPEEDEDVEDEAALKKIQTRVAKRDLRGFSFTRLLSEVEAPVCRFGIEYPLQHILKLEVGGALHSKEKFYAGSLWKIFVQLYKDEKNDGQLMLGMFLHRRRADAKSERFVDERERVALRFQFTCPCQRGLIVLGTVACDSKETYMPPSPKGWGWRSALSRDEIASDEFMKSIKCLRIIASLRIVL